MTRLAELSGLARRRALVTGATGGIGRVIAQTLAELGAELLLVDRPGATYEDVTREVTACADVPVETFECDLEREEDRARLVQRVRQDARGLAILVNNAAFVGMSTLQGWVTPFEEQSVDTWRRALEVNLTAVFDLTKGLAPVMRATSGASIVNIGSLYGLYGPDYRLYEGTAMGNPAAYAASKGGLLQLTRWLATTLAPQVRVNAISPGGIFRNHPDSFAQRYAARTPLGRMGSEDDLRGAIAYLASDLSRYVTGQNLSVDGGWGIW